MHLSSDPTLQYEATINVCIEISTKSYGSFLLICDSYLQVLNTTYQLLILDRCAYRLQSIIRSGFEETTDPPVCLRNGKPISIIFLKIFKI